MRMVENKILSFGGDKESLMERESTLCKHGFRVVSVG
jgi:hypothetical protein